MKARKIASAFLAAMLAVSAAAFPVSAEDEIAEKPYTQGDVNGDGKITISDAVLIARINAEDTSLHLLDEAITAADANNDSKQDADDLTDILRYLAGLLKDLNYKNVEYTFTASNLTENIKLDEKQESAYAEGFRASQLSFTANMLKEVAKQEGTDKNLLISPYSIAMALGMTANGAKEKTLEEMEKVLGGKLGIDALNDSYLKILLDSAKQPSYGKAELDIANSIWYRQDERSLLIPEQFLRNTVNYYHAAAYAANAFDKPVVQDINHWVSENTHGMIDSILKEPDSPDEYDDLLMVLINALAFEADWSEKFTDRQIGRTDFTLEDGTKFASDMMYGEECTYFESEKAVGFKKYYSGCKYSYIAMLPNADISVNDYTTQMDAAELTQFLDSETTKYDVRIGLPKYSYDFNAMLNTPLSNMGMPTAFDPNAANFKNLNASETAGNTYISAVIHKTYIAVDEAGTKAGAVTAVITNEATAIAPRENKTVILNRPFLYMLYDEDAELPIFIGTVMQPSEAESAE